MDLNLTTDFSLAKFLSFYDFSDFFPLLPQFVGQARIQFLVTLEKQKGEIYWQREKGIILQTIFVAIHGRKYKKRQKTV